MKRLFQNKYRVDTTRLQSWNYASAGMYFVTINTKNRKRYFGEIIKENGEAFLKPSEIGTIALAEWHKSIEMRPDMNLESGGFFIMPDHIHGVMIIGKNRYNSQRVDISGVDKAAMQCASPRSGFGPQSKNLASIIKGYKSAVTTYARKNNIEFNWQSLFDDRIIHSYDDYCRVEYYIRKNPDNWKG